MSHIYENDTKPILSDPPYLLQFILSVVLSVLCGATIMFMWNWFVVPLGLPMIGLVQALGLYSKGLHDQRQEDRASIYGSYSPHVQETLPK